MLIGGWKVLVFSIPTEGAVTQQHQHKCQPAAVWPTPNETDQNFKEPNSRRIITMRTSSQRLAAVRKREAMLLASVNCSNLCLNLGSYLPAEKIISLYDRQCYIRINRPPVCGVSFFHPAWLRITVMHSITITSLRIPEPTGDGSIAEKCNAIGGNSYTLSHVGCNIYYSLNTLILHHVSGEITSL